MEKLVQNLTKSLLDANVRCLQNLNLVSSDEDDKIVQEVGYETDDTEKSFDFFENSTIEEFSNISRTEDIVGDNMTVSDLKCNLCNKTYASKELMDECCKNTSENGIHDLRINKIESLSSKVQEGKASSLEENTDIHEGNAPPSDECVDVYEDNALLSEETIVDESKVAHAKVSAGHNKEKAPLFKKSQLMCKEYAKKLQKTIEFKCTLCDQIYKTKKMLDRHDMIKHNQIKTAKSDSVCQICYVTFASLKWLNNHYVKKHKCKAAQIAEFHRNSQSYKCPGCSLTFTEFSLYKEHVEMIHLKTIVNDNVAYRQCTLCDEKYPYGHDFKILFEHYIHHFNGKETLNDSKLDSTTDYDTITNLNVSVPSENNLDNCIENVVNNISEVSNEVEACILISDSEGNSNDDGNSRGSISHAYGNSADVASNNMLDNKMALADQLNAQGILSANMPSSSGGMQQSFTNTEFKVNIAPQYAVSSEEIDKLYAVATSQLEHLSKSKFSVNVVHAIQQLQRNYDSIKHLLKLSKNGDYVQNMSIEERLEFISLETGNDKALIDKVANGGQRMQKASKGPGRLNGMSVGAEANEVLCFFLHDFVYNFKTKTTSENAETTSVNVATTPVRSLNCSINEFPPIFESLMDVKPFQTTSVHETIEGMVLSPTRREDLLETSQNTSHFQLEQLNTIKMSPIRPTQMSQRSEENDMYQSPSSISNEGAVRNFFHAPTEEDHAPPPETVTKEEINEDVKPIFEISSDSSDTEVESEELSRTMPVLSPQINLAQKKTKLKSTMLRDLSVLDQDKVSLTPDHINDLIGILADDKGVSFTLQITKNNKTTSAHVMHPARKEPTKPKEAPVFTKDLRVELERLSPEDLVSRLPNKQEQIIYKCPYCVFKTALLRAVKMHMIRTHSKDGVKTFKRIIRIANVEKRNVPKPTSKKLKSKADVIQKKTNNFAIFKCVHCDAQYLNSPGIQLHIKRCHRHLIPPRTAVQDKHYEVVNSKSNEAVTKCSLCDFKTLSQTGLRTHMARKHPKPIKRKQGRPPKTVPKLKLRLIETPKPKLTPTIPEKAPDLLYKCMLCEFVSASRKSIRLHLFGKHNMRKPTLKVITHDRAFDGANFRCDLCPMNYPALARLQRHYETKHKPVLSSESFVCRCAACHLELQSEPALRKHILQVHMRKANPDTSYTSTKSSSSSKKSSSDSTYTCTTNSSSETSYISMKKSSSVKKAMPENNHNSMKKSIPENSYAAMSNEKPTKSVKTKTPFTKPTAIYRCLYCNERAKHLDIIEAHTNYAHPNTPNITPEPLKNVTELFDGFAYSCNKCAYVAVASKSMKKHYHSKHGPRSNLPAFCMCSLCDYESRCDGSLRKHMNMKHMKHCKLPKRPKLLDV